MRGVILAAGEGSRMRPHTADVPKAFLEVAGRPLFDRQREALADHVDGVTVVLGYRHEAVADWTGDADVVVFEEWADYDNAESLRRALATVDDDVLVLNGDVLVAEPVVEGVVRRHAELAGEYSLVGCLPGVQSEHTAIRTDDDGVVTDYGLIRGRRHAGLGVVDRAHHDAAETVLRANADDWYPHVYPAVPTRAVTVPAPLHVELNRPGDLAVAEARLPFAREDETGPAVELAAGSGQ